MKSLLIISFALLQIFNSVSSLHYLYGPDSAGKAAIVTLTPNEVSACPVTFPILPIPDLVCTSVTIIKGQLVICGGERDGFKSQYCFKLVQDVWEEFPPLPEVRTCATSVWIKNHTQWWLTGGKTDEGSTSSSVIYDIETESWKEGPKMPWPIYGHCLVPLDSDSPISDDRFMLLSGYYTLQIIGNTYNTNVYILEGEEWVEQQGELNYRYKRYASSQTCNRLKNGNVLLLGGKPDGDNEEIWDAKYGFWSTAQDEMKSPVWIWYPSSALDEDGNLYVVGGDAHYADLFGQILKFDSETWTVFDNVLPYPMSRVSINLLQDTDDITC